MSDWLFDTLLYSGLLIALVLLLRRPAARWFGPQAAYALWSLPLLRLLLPPLTLPASLAPEPEPFAEGGTAMTVMVVEELAPPELAAAAEPASIAWGAVALSLWAGVALAFLAWRVWSYAGMRRSLLKAARPVGEAGRVRLVETPAVGSPVAFGVLDKVVALPDGFMAMEDRHARDLAIAHELAHHRGHDLLANILAQPLLALHWFNPVAWYGWRAMRRDQEAACDARVMQGREFHERAVYGRVIAGFAAGPNLALAAPMACPVLGEKSIIHRLRSLTMSDISPRRRTLGRTLLAGAALAVPLTASVSYAEAISAPPAPEAPLAPPAPPAPLEEVPVPPSAPLAPEAPAAPTPPMAPEAPHAVQRVKVIQADGSEGEQEFVFAVDDGEGGNRQVHRYVYKSDGGWNEEEFERRMEELSARLEAMDMERMEETIRSAMEEAHKAMEKAHAAQALAHEEMRKHRVEVEVIDSDGAVRIDGRSLECKDGQGSFEEQLDGGKKVIVICRTEIRKQAMRGLEEARKAIASDPAMPAETRKRVLEKLDRQIAAQRAS